MGRLGTRLRISCTHLASLRDHDPPAGLAGSGSLAAAAAILRICAASRTFQDLGLNVFAAAQKDMREELEETARSVNMDMVPSDKDALWKRGFQAIAFCWSVPR